MKEITLTNGTIVRVRSVSPFLPNEAVSKRLDLRIPPPPLEEVKSKLGTQTLPARTGTPQYEKWMQDREEIEELRDSFREDVVWTWGIIEWKHPDSDDWVKEPPKGWKFAAEWKDFGLVPREGKNGKRLDYLKFELFSSSSDALAVQQIMYNNPLTQQEVGAQRESFQSNKE